MFQDFLNGGKWCRGGNWKCCWGGFFYPPRWWQPGGVILAIRTFFKTKKQHSVNTEHQLKSKLAWPVCQKSIKLKQIEWGELAFGREGIKIWWRGSLLSLLGGEQIFGWLGDSPLHANPSTVNPLFSVKMSKNKKDEIVTLSFPKFVNFYHFSAPEEVRISHNFFTILLTKILIDKFFCLYHKQKKKKINNW